MQTIANDEDFIEKLCDLMMKIKENNDTNIANSSTIYSRVMSNVYEAFGEDVCQDKHREISKKVSQKLRSIMAS